MQDSAEIEKSVDVQQPVKHPGTGTWAFRDNLFDQVLIATNSGKLIDVCGNNAYMTNLTVTTLTNLLPNNHDVFLTSSPAYQVGSLGQNYYPTNQTNLIYKGSQLAAAAGLYHYTVTTNNTIDGINMVSIGLHYVATDNNGVSLDSNGNGLPDYVEDANGDGVFDSGDPGNWQNPFNIYDQQRSYGGYTPANVRLSYWRFNTSALKDEQGDSPSTGASPPIDVPADWSGTSVYIGAGTNLQYETMESGSWTNFDAANGTVRFWFKPHWSSANVPGGTGPGQNSNATFLDISTSSGSWDLQTTSNGEVIQFRCSSGLIAALSSGGGLTQAPGNWNSTFTNGQWYQIALTYSPSNIAAYINGALIGTGIWPPQDNGGPLFQYGYGMYVWPTIGTSVAFCVGNDTTSKNPMNGEMDELETFNYPLSAQAIAYGFATFNGCSTNNTLDTDYDGRSDLMENLVDGTSRNNPSSMAQCRLGYWRFNTSSWIGEEGQFPISANGVTLGTGWSGGALNVGSTANSGLTYPDVYSNGWANINCRQGSVRFWFQPNSPTLPASTPFIYLGTGSSDYWTLESGSSANTISFFCASNGASSNPILNISAPFATNQWTQIVFTYGPSGRALYTNGTLAQTNSAVFTNWPNASVRALGMVIGNDSTGNYPINGKFDELETFNCQLNTNQIWTNFFSVWNVDNNLDGIPDIIQDTVLAKSLPFLGAPVVVAGTIEAEQFDRGGTGIAYSNAFQNPTSGYRNTGMYITTNNMPFGYCLDQTRSNKWANYTIDVLVPQTYAIETRVQGLGTNSVFQYFFATNNGTSFITYTNTGLLTNTTTAWTNVTGYAGLKAGINIMTLKFLNNGMTNVATATNLGRFDYMTVYPWWSPPTYGPTTTNVNLTAGNNFSTASNNAYLIQSAINSLPSSGGIVAITNTGTFYVAQPKPAEQFDAYWNSAVGFTTGNIKITGQGMSNTVLVGYNRATTIFSLGLNNASQSGQCTNLTFENMTLQAQPHMAVNTNNPTQVVYQSGMIYEPPPNNYHTGALTVIGGVSTNAYAYNILFTNCQFVNADREIDIGGYTSNVLVQNCSFVQFQGTNGSYIPNECDTSIQFSSPDTNVIVGIFVQGGLTYNSLNIGVVGCTYNGNPGATNYIVGLTSGNGFLYYQNGGNFFALRNFITNNCEEAVQFGGGPVAVTGNTFWSWADNNSSCALAPNMGPIYGPAATGLGLSNYSVTFVGNSVTGNTFGACNDTGGAQGPYTLNFSGNSLSLYPPLSDPATNALLGGAVTMWGCQSLNICGNTTSNGSAVVNGNSPIFYSSTCSNWVILANDFSRVTRGTIEDWGTGPVVASQVIGNTLSLGYSYHLKTLFQAGPSWFLYNNKYVDTNQFTVPSFTDAVSLWAHITP